MAEACPCGTGSSYAACCQPRHTGISPAETAEELMRSRYSAFCHGQVEYLVATAHPSRRQPDDREQLAHRFHTTRWLHLKIVDSKDGTAADREGVVEFIATFREGSGTLMQMQERSSFVREGGRWFYVSGDLQPARPVPTPGRNAPCWCGSGKKFKKCHR